MNNLIKQAIIKNEDLDLSFKLVKLYSIKTGLCAEKCAFCGQSSLVSKKVKPIKEFTSIKEIYLAIDDAKNNLADEILFVASGTRLSDKSELELLAKGIIFSKKEGLEVGLDLGLMHPNDLRYLFDAGADIYVTAVQTAKSFFQNVISSHNYEDKIKVLENAKNIGYSTRCVGILGLGEDEKQRYEFASELQTLPCDTIGLSLFQPIKGSVMEKHPKMSSLQAMNALAIIRTIIDKPIYLLGGREKIISEEHMQNVFQMINGTTVGNYLFTEGQGIDKIMSNIPSTSKHKKYMGK